MYLKVMIFDIPVCYLMVYFTLGNFVYYLY